MLARELEMLKKLETLEERFLGAIDDLKAVFLGINIIWEASSHFGAGLNYDELLRAMNQIVDVCNDPDQGGLLRNKKPWNHIKNEINAALLPELIEIESKWINIGIDFKTGLEQIKGRKITAYEGNQLQKKIRLFTEALTTIEEKIKFFINRDQPHDANGVVVKTKKYTYSKQVFDQLNDINKMEWENTFFVLTNEYLLSEEGSFFTRLKEISLTLDSLRVPSCEEKKIQFGANDPQYDNNIITTTALPLNLKLRKAYTISAESENATQNGLEQQQHALFASGNAIDRETYYLLVDITNEAIAAIQNSNVLDKEKETLRHLLEQIQAILSYGRAYVSVDARYAHGDAGHFYISDRVNRLLVNIFDDFLKVKACDVTSIIAELNNISSSSCLTSEEWKRIKDIRSNGLRYSTGDFFGGQYEDTALGALIKSTEPRLAPYKERFTAMQEQILQHPQLTRSLSELIPNLDIKKIVSQLVPISSLSLDGRLGTTITENTKPFQPYFLFTQALTFALFGNKEEQSLIGQLPFKALGERIKHEEKVVGGSRLVIMKDIQPTVILENIANLSNHFLKDKTEAHEIIKTMLEKLKSTYAFQLNRQKNQYIKESKKQENVENTRSFDFDAFTGELLIPVCKLSLATWEGVTEAKGFHWSSEESHEQVLDTSDQQLINSLWSALQNKGFKVFYHNVFLTTKEWQIILKIFDDHPEKKTLTALDILGIVLDDERCKDFNLCGLVNAGCQFLADETNQALPLAINNVLGTLDTNLGAKKPFIGMTQQIFSQLISLKFPETGFSCQYSIRYLLSQRNKNLVLDPSRLESTLLMDLNFPLKKIIGILKNGSPRLLKPEITPQETAKIINLLEKLEFEKITAYEQYRHEILTDNFLSIPKLSIQIKQTKENRVYQLNRDPNFSLKLSRQNPKDWIIIIDGAEFSPDIIDKEKSFYDFLYECTKMSEIEFNQMRSNLLKIQLKSTVEERQSVIEQRRSVIMNKEKQHEQDIREAEQTIEKYVKQINAFEVKFECGNADSDEKILGAELQLKSKLRKIVKIEDLKYKQDLSEALKAKAEGESAIGAAMINKLQQIQQVTQQFLSRLNRAQQRQVEVEENEKEAEWQKKLEREINVHNYQKEFDELVKMLSSKTIKLEEKAFTYSQYDDVAKMARGLVDKIAEAGRVFFTNPTRKTYAQFATDIKGIVTLDVQRKFSEHRGEPRELRVLGEVLLKIVQLILIVPFVVKACHHKKGFLHGAFDFFQLEKTDSVKKLEEFMEQSDTFIKKISYI